MKILWLSHLIPYPPKGGVLMRSYHLLRELARYHEVHLVAFNQRSLLDAYFSSGDGEDLARIHFKEFLADCHFFDIPSEKSLAGKEWLALKSLVTRAPYTINWLQSDAYRVFLREYIKSRNFDVVHFDTVSLVPYRNEISRQVLCVLDHHNVESHMLLRRAGLEKNILKKAYFFQEGRRLLNFERDNLKNFDLHITCSEDDRSRLSEVYPFVNSIVVPNGISLPSHYPERTSSCAKKLLFVGGLSWYPNADAMQFFLSEVWPIIAKEDPEVSIDIVGRSPPKAILDIAKIDSRIRVHGFVDDITPFYTEAAVYVCTIRDGGGTKLKILDALAHRVPLVAHPISCEGIDVIPGLHALVVEQPSDIADGVLELLSDGKKAQALGDEGYNLIRRKYDFCAIGKEFSDALVELKGAR